MFTSRVFQCARNILSAICNERFAGGMCIHAQPHRCGKDSHINPAKPCYSAPKRSLHVSRKILPLCRNEYCFSKSSAAVCLCCGGGEIQQAPGLFQAARNNTLTPQRGIKRASKQTSCAGESFYGFLTGFKRKVGLGVYARERTSTCALKFLKQVDLAVITYHCFVFVLFQVIFCCFVSSSDLFQELTLTLSF